MKKEEFVELLKNIMKTEDKNLNISKINESITESLHLIKLKKEFIKTKYEKELKKFNIDISDSVRVEVSVDYYTRVNINGDSI